MKQLDKQLRKRGILILLYLLSCLAITLLAWPYVKMLLDEEQRVLIHEKVEGYGIFAPLIYVGLHIAHIIFAFIPGEPIEIMGGVLFGTVPALFYSLLGILIGTTVVFLLVRKFGKPFVFAIFDEEKLNRFKILQDEKRLEGLVFLLFLIPGTPKDLLTYFVPLTKIDPTRYLLIAVFARIPSIITSTLLGSTLEQGRFALSAIVFGITTLIAVIGYFAHRYITK